MNGQYNLLLYRYIGVESLDSLPFPPKICRKLFWLGWSFGIIYMFLLFPVTPLLKGDFLAGGRNKDVKRHALTFQADPEKS